jgi:hypothetical protein
VELFPLRHDAGRLSLRGPSLARPCCDRAEKAGDAPQNLLPGQLSTHRGQAVGAPETPSELVRHNLPGHLVSAAQPCRPIEHHAAIGDGRALGIGPPDYVFALSFAVVISFIAVA